MALFPLLSGSPCTGVAGNSSGAILATIRKPYALSAGGILALFSLFSLFSVAAVAVAGSCWLEIILNSIESNHILNPFESNSEAVLHGVK